MAMVKNVCFSMVSKHASRANKNAGGPVCYRCGPLVACLTPKLRTRPQAKITRCCLKRQFVAKRRTFLACGKIQVWVCGHRKNGSCAWSFLLIQGKNGTLIQNSPTWTPRREPSTRLRLPSGQPVNSSCHSKWTPRASVFRKNECHC